jgi:hypothetical protein
MGIIGIFEEKIAKMKQFFGTNITIYTEKLEKS